jgi:voltage-gated sodium channel
MISLSRIARRITEHPVFQRVILGVILFSAALVGVKTYPEVYSANKDLLYGIDSVILAIFTVEVALRILSYGTKPWRYFRTPWNVFDFLITVVFYIPSIGQFASILRIARVLRVLRLVTAIPKLQMLVGALLNSVPSMGYITLLLFIQFYVFAVIGNVLFGMNDPEHFGNLHTSMLTLFQIVTLEGWTEIMKRQGDGLHVVLYFISFILLGTMIILNLFIGVIMSGFDEVKREIDEQERANSQTPAHGDLRAIRAQVDEIRQKLDALIDSPQLPKVPRKLA